MLKYLPNLISIIRLLSTPVLVWLVYQRATESFAWLLLAASVSDFLDGWLARRFDWTSQLGALLDSLADVVLMIVTFFAIWELHRYVFLEHGFILVIFLLTWTSVHTAAFYRYRKLASFHTLLTRVAIVLFGLFALLLFFFQFVGWLWYLAGVLGILAGFENLLLIKMLPNWQPNQRAGLIPMLRKRRSRS